MLFASTSLAARIERAECRLLSTSAAAVAARRSADVLVRPIAGGIATYTGEGSPLNKLAGLGFDGPPQESELESIESAFAERRTALQVELSSLADPAVAPLLSRRGYTLEGFENVLGLGLPLAERRAVSEEIEISPSGTDEIDTWLEVLVTGFAHPDAQGVASHETFPREALERVMRDMAEAEGFERVLARLDGQPVGGAGMRIGDGVAQLCGAATLPTHRRRGVQSSLLAVRLARAGEAGCDVAVVTTQPGSKSQENVQRQGFELLYTRAILVRSR